MATCSIRGRPPRGPVEPVEPMGDTDVVAAHLEDAAHFSGGHADALFAPASEAGVAHVLRVSRAVLPIGAQSSLTGGATPFGESLLSTARLNHVGPIGTDSVRVGAGVTLADLDAALLDAGRYYPPAPTFMGAFVGGTVSTNAAGAATFKYGATREWVRALTVVLASGDVLDVERGAVRAHRDGYFDFDLSGGRRRVPVPTYRMPDVAKLSAGYFAEPGMDLIDLFIGSEGTLGVVTEATLRVRLERPACCLVFVTFARQERGWSFVRQLREAAIATWRSGDRSGIDVSAIESMDARCLALLREDGSGLPPLAGSNTEGMGILLVLELPPGTTSAEVYDQIGAAADRSAPDTPIGRLCGLLAEHGALDAANIAAPGDRARAAQLLGVREAVPTAVNQRVGLAKRTVDARIDKVAADVCVPVGELETLVAFCHAECRRLKLDLAVWGHVSDGNIHPNVIPRTMEDVERGRLAMLAIGREAIRLGGTPLAEHGVGRNATKQRLLLDLYGPGGIDDMRRVKAALDPEGKLSPGVIFPAAARR